MTAPRDRLIVALDVETIAAAEALVGRLGDSVRWLKVGLELFVAEGPAAVAAARRGGSSIMLDLKLHDIPETVARATSRAADLGAELLTIHTAGGWKMMEAAAKTARGSGLKLLGVTVLTSMDDAEIARVGDATSVAELVRRRAQLAMECGLDGVVASAHEAAAIRAAAPTNFLIVTPGIRPKSSGPTGRGSSEGATSPKNDDQARVATAAAARAAGADAIVVGRPIRDASDPRAAAEAIVAELAAADAAARKA